MQIGHNSQDYAFTVTIRLFNSIHRYAADVGGQFEFDVRPGETVGEIARRLGIPTREIFLILVNGRDISPGLVGGPVRESRQLEAGDVVAFSGPVPYSFGYGAPVV